MLFREGRQKTRSCFDQHDSSCPGIDAPEVAGQGLSRDFGYGARHLDTGGAAADDHESEQPLALGVVASELRFLKRGQNAATDTGRVFDALEARGDLGQRSRPKYEFRAPVAITRKSKENGPALVFTTRAPTSMPITSAINTVAFFCWRRIWRIGQAISAGDSAAVATW